MKPAQERFKWFHCCGLAGFAISLNAFGADKSGPLNPFVIAGGAFTEVSQFGSGPVLTMSWGDYDGDSDLDLAVGNNAGGGRLFTNNGDGTFTGANQFGSGPFAPTMFALAWADFDNDGDLDMAVGNVGTNKLYINNGDGTFTSNDRFGALNTITMAWADFDLDGDLDLAVGNGILGGNEQNFLFVNNGDGTFTERAEFGANQTQTMAWGDFDRDGDPDLAVGNGGFGFDQANALYVNNGDGTFTARPEFGTGIGQSRDTTSLQWGDFDNDGDLDLACGNEHSAPSNYLYVNNLNDNASLRVHLVGHYFDRGSGFSNRDGIGARISVYESGGLGDSDRLLGYREIEAHSGFSPQNAIDAHFGLQGRSKVDLRIVWPGSGDSHLTQDLRGTPVGQRLVIHEGPTVPTISQWGVFVMLLGLLVAAALVQMRRVRRTVSVSS